MDFPHPWQLSPSFHVRFPSYLQTHQAPQSHVADILETVDHRVESFLEVGFFRWHLAYALHSTSNVICQFLQHRAKMALWTQSTRNAQHPPLLPLCVEHHQAVLNSTPCILHAFCSTAPNAPSIFDTLDPFLTTFLGPHVVHQEHHVAQFPRFA